MQTIWKATVEPQRIQEISIPADSEMLCASEQHGKICVWFKCDPGRDMRRRDIIIVGTGHDAPIDGKYIGTAFLHNGELVCHVFDGGPSI